MALINSDCLVDRLGNSTTLLHWAVFYHQVEIIRLLLNFNPDCNRWGKCIGYEGTPLEIAKQIGT